MRTVLALTLMLASAPHAGALTIRPREGTIAPSPNGRFVYVHVDTWTGRERDPDAETIRATCKTSGLYEPGAWGAPLWSLEVQPQWGTFYPANDGTHIAVHDACPFEKATSFDVLHAYCGDPVAGRRRAALAAPAFALFANGKLVRSVTVHEITGSAQGALDRGVIGTAEFGADGLFRVTSGDGNRTAWDPATGERVEGNGAPPEPEARDATDAVVAVPVLLVVLGAAGYFARRHARRRVAA